MLTFLPDHKPQRLRAKFSSAVPTAMIDKNPFFSYELCEEMNDLDDDELSIPEVKLAEYIFVIDRSGSMTGKRIELAVEAMKLLIHSLPIGSYYNIISFGSEPFQKMFNKS